MRTFIIVPLVLALNALAVNAKEPVLESLVISAGAGDITYQVELANTPAKMQRGLMFRDSMPENHGMLFVYDPERPASMWMKNTILSLDMLFIDRDGVVINIAERTEPFSLKTIPSGGPVRAVLELNAGQAAEHGIATGDKVIHPVFE